MRFLRRLRYTVGMTKEYMTVDYERKYQDLWNFYRDEVIRHKEYEDRMLSQLRHQMIANVQISKELDEARELIDTLLTPVEKSKTKRDY